MNGTRLSVTHAEAVRRELRAMQVRINRVESRMRRRWAVERKEWSR